MASSSGWCLAGRADTSPAARDLPDAIRYCWPLSGAAPVNAVAAVRASIALAVASAASDWLDVSGFRTSARHPVKVAAVDTGELDGAQSGIVAQSDCHRDACRHRVDTDAVTGRVWIDPVCGKFRSGLH